MTEILFRKMSYEEAHASNSTKPKFIEKYDRYSVNSWKNPAKNPRTLGGTSLRPVLPSKRSRRASIGAPISAAELIGLWLRFSVCPNLSTGAGAGAGEVDVEIEIKVQGDGRGRGRRGCTSTGTGTTRDSG
jgi:hypothetical protein